MVMQTFLPHCLTNELIKIKDLFNLMVGWLKYSSNQLLCSAESRIRYLYTATVLFHSNLKHF